MRGLHQQERVEEIQMVLEGVVAPVASPVASKLRRWSAALLILALLGMGVTSFSLLAPWLSREFAIAYFTAEKVVEFHRQDLAGWERVVLTLWLSLPNVGWLFCLLPILRLALELRQDVSISRQVIVRMRQFGQALFCLAIIAGCMYPGLSWFMVWRGHSGPIKDLWSQTLESGLIDNLLASALVVIVVELLQLGQQAQEESKLTI